MATLKIGQKQFLANLATFGPFYRVGHREEGTSVAEMLSNDTTFKSVGQLVWTVQVITVKNDDSRKGEKKKFLNFGPRRPKKKFCDINRPF